MTRRRKDPLRDLTADEKRDLESISRARSAPAEAVTRAKLLLGVASGLDYQQAARSAGRKNGDAVSALVSRFNWNGKRRQRRDRARARRLHRAGGSGATTPRPIDRLNQWRRSCQLSH